MVYAQAFLEQLVLRGDHVVVVVLRKVGVHAVARLARFSMTDVVGKDDEIATGVEELAGTEEDVGKLRSEKLVSRTAGAVQDQDGVRHFSVGIALGLAEGQVVQAEFGESFAGLEMEVAGEVITFNGRGLRHGWR